MIIDADGHYNPIIPGVIHTGDAYQWIRHYINKQKGKFDNAERRLEEMTKDLKVDRQLLNPMGKASCLDYDVKPEIAGAVMAAYNDQMLKLCDKYDQFDTNLCLLLQNIPACIEEVKRNLGKKFFGVYVSDIPAYGFSSSFEPMWALLAENNIPWYMHPHNPRGLDLVPDSEWAELYDKINKHYVNDPWFVAYASMIAGGVFERHPTLKVMFVERDINWVQGMRDLFAELGLPDPLPTLQKNVWFTTEPEMPTFVSDANLLGWDRLLFATDWPHDFDMGGKNSREDVNTVESLEITEAQRHMLYQSNYEQFGR